MSQTSIAATATADPSRTVATGVFGDQVLTTDGGSVLVTQGGDVMRYDLGTGALTGSWHVAQQIGGIDVSTDGRYLYATDLQPISVTFDPAFYVAHRDIAVDRLDLQTGAVTTYTTTVSGGDSNFFDVATTSDGKVLLTEDYNGSGFEPLTLLDPSTGAFSFSQERYAQAGTLTANADHTQILFGPYNISSEPLYIYSVGSGITAGGEYLNDDSGGFNQGVQAISASGAMSVQGIYNALYLYGTDLTPLGNLLSIQPEIGTGIRDIVGVAFSPDGSMLYVLNAYKQEVFALSTTDWSIRSVIPLHIDAMPAPYSYLYSHGDTLAVSPDGHVLSILSDTGIETIDLTQVTPTPVLTTLSLPATTTIGADGGNLFITAGATDATSTVQSVAITLDHAIQTMTGAIDHITFDAANDGYDDGYSAVNLALTGAAVGTYTVTSAVVTDQAGHMVSYDAAGLTALFPDTSFTVVAQVDLTSGNDIYHHDPSLAPLTINGLDGNDSLYAGSTDDTLDGGAGNDTLFAGTGSATLYGGDGVDTLVLPGNVSDYYDAGSGTGNPFNISSDTLLARDGSAVLIIGSDIEHVQFANGSFLTFDNMPTGSGSSFGFIEGDYTLLAPSEGHYFFNGGSGANEVVLAGTVTDYTLGRVQGYSGIRDFSAVPGDFILGSGYAYYTFDESIDTIRFSNGQYLALKDLPAYVTGSAALGAGDAQDDLLYQVKSSGYEGFVGGDGIDQVYLTGNVSDYTVRAFTGAGTGVSAFDDIALSGLELVANNGSGALLIDGSVETVHFQNGQYLSFGDIEAYIMPASPSEGVLHLALDGPGASFFALTGSEATNDVGLLDGNVSDYTLDRDNAGNFELTGYDQTVFVGQSIETVQFGNGQYLTLADLPAYLTGDATFTSGTDGNDILVAGSGGDQYLVGGDGIDLAELHGNAQDYIVRAATQTNSSNPAIDGYELIAVNSSGNIFVDRSTETIRFQNGQSVAFADLPGATLGIAVIAGTDGHDVFVADHGGDLYVNGGAGLDDLYLFGNTRDYDLQSVNVAATADHAAINGYELVADNGSGNIYIDSSVETVHFQNGQYLAFSDLQHYIG